MRRRRVSAGNLSLAVWIEDDAKGTAASDVRPTVVILHGFTGSAESMIEVAEALSPRFRTLCIDLVGHGASDAPDDVRAYSMEACVEQLCRVLDACDVERAGWLGYSMGGRTVLQLAAAHPERVDRMLLVGASAGLADADERARRVAADEALADRIEQQGVAAFVDEWMALPLFASQNRLGHAALSAARRQRLRNRAHGLANSLRGMGTGAQPPLHDVLPRLAMPTCIAVGDEDAKFQAIGEQLLARLPTGSARLATVPKAGHAAHLENPSAFASLAHEFFGEMES